MVPYNTTTDPESADHLSVEDGDEVPEMTIGAIDSRPNGSAVMRKLSTVSKMYDVDGDGELDAAELAMRDMDKSNRGYLTNDKVYKMMQEQMETQRQLFRVKKIVFVLLALVVILAISNLGTSFAAASLAKDTTTSSNAEVIDKHSNEALSTQTSTETLTIERATVDQDGTRRLNSDCDKTEDGQVLNCDLTATSNERNDINSGLTLDKNSCKQLFKMCRRSNTVTLTRPWPKNGQDTFITVCPFKTGTLNRNDRSLLETSEGKTVIIEPIAGGHCKISGSAIHQTEGAICGQMEDCAPGLTCEIREQYIENCQARCAMKRWAPRMVDQCQTDCDHPSCVVVDDFLLH